MGGLARLAPKGSVGPSFALGRGSIRIISVIPDYDELRNEAPRLRKGNSLSVTSVLVTLLPDYSSLSGDCEIFRELGTAEVGWSWVVI